MPAHDELLLEVLRDWRATEHAPAFASAHLSTQYDAK